jgi:hypothetical protein
MYVSVRRTGSATGDLIAAEGATAIVGGHRARDAPGGHPFAEGALRDSRRRDPLRDIGCDPSDQLVDQPVQIDVESHRRRLIMDDAAMF